MRQPKPLSEDSPLTRNPQTLKRERPQSIPVQMQEEAFEKVKLQVGPCGITCGTCPLGNGTIAETSKKTLEYVNGYGIKEWAPSSRVGRGWTGRASRRPSAGSPPTATASDASRAAGPRTAPSGAAQKRKATSSAASAATSTVRQVRLARGTRDHDEEEPQGEQGQDKGRAGEGSHQGNGLILLFFAR